MSEMVTVVGAGLAGCEAAWQLAQRGISVRLCEMKPVQHTPAHHSDDFAELVCSNSLRSDELANAAGLLKEELRRLDSLILSCADAHRVEAGGALAVDREAFAAAVTEKIKNHPNIEVVYGEVTEIPEGRVVIASGPLTSDTLFDAIHAKVGGDFPALFTMLPRRLSRLRASIWIPPTRLPATARAPQITSTARSPARSTRRSGTH